MDCILGVFRMFRFLLRYLAFLPLALCAFLVGVCVVPIHAVSAAPYVIFKFDDLDSGSYAGFKWTTDLLRSKGAKGGVGIFTGELDSLPGNSAYENYVRGLISDPNFEVWFHSIRNAEALHMRSTDFDAARKTLLSKFDYLPRTYGPHWSGGDSTTALHFNSDPFFKVWLLWGSWLPVQQVTNLQGLPDDYCVRLEMAGPTPGVLTPIESFKATYNGYCKNRELLVLEGHAWAYTDATRQSTFSQVVDFLNTSGVQWSNAWEYHKLKSGITDVTAPPAPTVTLSRLSTTSIRVSWNTVIDGVAADGYKVYRNGNFIALVRGTSHDDSGSSLPDSTQYQVSAINVANLSSARSAAVSLSNPGGTAPAAPSGLTVSGM